MIVKEKHQSSIIPFRLDLDCEKDSLPNKLKTNKACKNLKLSCDTIKSSQCKNTLGTIVNSKCRKKLSNTERKTDISDYCGKCNSKCGMSKSFDSNPKIIKHLI